MTSLDFCAMGSRVLPAGSCGLFWRPALFPRGAHDRRWMTRRSSGEHLPAEALHDRAPSSLRGPQHDPDRHAAQQQEIERAEIGQGLAQREEHDGADERPTRCGRCRRSRLMKMTNAVQSLTLKAASGG